MPASDDLKKLSERAKVAEDHAATAKTQARAELEKTVTDVRASSQAQAKKLQAQAQAAKTDAAESWDDVQRSWNAHIAKVREDVQRKTAQLNAADSSDRADWAETDASLAIDYAYSAIEEAEYAVLDAILARREAEDAAMAVPR